MQPQAVLHVGDLLPAALSPEAREEELMGLGKVVVRYTSELRAVYRWYAAQEQGRLPEARGNFCLSLEQFKKLWADCQLGAYGVPFAAVHRLVAAMRRQFECEVKALQLARRQAAASRCHRVPAGTAGRQCRAAATQT